MQCLHQDPILVSSYPTMMATNFDRRSNCLRPRLEHEDSRRKRSYRTRREVDRWGRSWARIAYRDAANRNPRLPGDLTLSRAIVTFCNRVGIHSLIACVLSHLDLHNGRMHCLWVSGVEGNISKKVDRVESVEITHKAGKTNGIKQANEQSLSLSLSLSTCIIKACQTFQSVFFW